MKRRVLSVMLVLTMLVGGTSLSSFAAKKPAAPKPVYWLQANSAFKGVALEWSPTNATSYDVYRNGKYIKNVKSNHYRIRNGKKVIWYYDRTGVVGGNSNSYYIVASKNNVKSAKSPTVRKKSVYPLYIYVTFKRDRTLTSQDGAVTRTFRRGLEVPSNNFRFGKYYFTYGGHTYRVNYESLKGFYANVTKSFNYTGKEAEYFVNTSGIDSDTDYLIWANQYTQRLFVFKGKQGQWKLLDKWEDGTKAYTWRISTGKAKTPTPQGLYLHIYKKGRSKDGVPWWCYFHSQTSLHGEVGNQGLDELRSGGCIRNPDKYAWLMWKYIPIGTRLIIY